MNQLQNQMAYMKNSRKRSYFRTLNEEAAEFLLEGLKGSSKKLIDVDYCKITEGGADVLMNGLKDVLVTHLNLVCYIDTDCMLKISQGLEFTKLTHLDLHFMTSICKYVSKFWEPLSEGLQCSQVTHLKLTFAQPTGDAFGVFTSSLKDAKITHLDLTGSKIGDAGTAKLAEGVKKSNLKELILASNDIGGEGGVSLIEALVQSKISLLDLSNNRIGEKGAAALASCLRDTQLMNLSLQGNKIGHNGIKMIIQSLKSTQITHLNLAGNGFPFFGEGILGSRITHLNLSDNDGPRDDFVQSLGLLLRDTEVTHLNLSKNGIDEEAAIAFVEGLPGCQVTHLDISYNTIGGRGIAALADSFQHTKLISLNLRACRVGDFGAKALAKALPLSEIQTLDLVENGISKTGATALAECLKDSKLSHLEFNHNNACTPGALSFGESLKKSNLTHLEFKANNIGAEGVKMLMEGSSGSNITHLSLGSNSSGDFLAGSLKNSKVTFLDLSHNKIKRIGIEQVAKSLKDSRVSSLNLSGNKIGVNGMKSFVGCLKDTEVIELQISHTIGDNDDDDDLSTLAYLFHNTQVTKLTWDACERVKLYFQPRIPNRNLEMWDNMNMNLNTSGSLYEFSDAREIFRKICHLNQLNVHRFVQLFKNKVVLNNDNKLVFSDEETNHEQCINDLIYFMQQVQSGKGMISHIYHDETIPFTRGQIETFMKNLGDYFATFVASTKPDYTIAVHILEKCERDELDGAVKSLLYHRPMFLVDDNLGILHPYAYKLLFKYDMLLFNEQIEPGSHEKIMRWCATHQEYKHARDVFILFKQNGVV